MIGFRYLKKDAKGYLHFIYISENIVNNYVDDLLGSGFVKRYFELCAEKDSFLCVGIDPVTSDMRDNFVIPNFLIDKFGVSEGLKKFCIDIIRAVGPYTPIIKPNAQFLTYALSMNDLKEIVEVIHEVGCLALLDCKLTDISSTNSSGLYWIDKLGFDAVTFSPFSGYTDGVEPIYKWSEKKDKGIFALCRMSNLGAHDYQSLVVNEDPLYLHFAKDAFLRGCNGYVVGCTAPRELGEIREIIGEERLILSPGLGPQGGNPEEALRLGTNSKGNGLIVSSSRSINYAYEKLGWDEEKYAYAATRKAEKKRDELNKYRLELFG